MRQNTAARESHWLFRKRQGYSVTEIARTAKVSHQRVSRGIIAARKRELEIKLVLAALPRKDPRANPIYPRTGFAPHAPCPHHGNVVGIDYCEQCAAYGNEHHPALRRDRDTDPQPDRKSAVEAVKKLNRKQKRALAMLLLKRIK